eukprot:7900472-Ditylum_brightwellii.AAC.1
MPLIAFEIEEGVVDRKLGESMYNLCTQPEEDNSPMYSLQLRFSSWVTQELRGQNMGDMDALYTL